MELKEDRVKNGGRFNIPAACIFGCSGTLAAYFLLGGFSFSVSNVRDLNLDPLSVSILSAALAAWILGGLMNPKTASPSYLRSAVRGLLVTLASYGVGMLLFMLAAAFLMYAQSIDQLPFTLLSIIAMGLLFAGPVIGPLGLFAGLLTEFWRRVSAGR